VLAETSIKFIWRCYWYGEAVAKKLENTTFKTIQHAAASTRLYAVRSIKRSKRPARPGEPVHTQTSRLPRAIVYAVDRQKMVAVIGPSFDKIGLVGHAHEFGGMMPCVTAQPEKATIKFVLNSPLKR
jgi:hypothetical protein